MKNAQSQNDEESKTEILSFEFHNSLPDFFKKSSSVFTNNQEKDIFLISAITMISGMLPNYFGVYDTKKIGANLYSFIVASAGSGKGVLSWVRNLAYPTHKHLKELSRDNINRMLLIPANNSSSGLIEALHDNKERGILMCTEADTLSGSLSQDWGNFSDILRASFHHEFYEMMRRADKEYKELKKPYLSVLLSGTPAQVHNLIPSTENGLFSRFIFYSFSTAPKMKNVFSDNKVDFDKHFETYGYQLLALFLKLSERENPIEFSFTHKQQKEFIDSFDLLHKEFHAILGIGSIGCIRRLGVVQFRIAMIFSILRHFENGDLPDKIICTEEDYDNSFTSIKMLRKHTIEIYSRVSKNKHEGKLSIQKVQFLEMLGEQSFTRDEALKLSTQIGMSRATFDRFLKTGFLEKVAHGIYRKAQLSK